MFYQRKDLSKSAVLSKGCPLAYSILANGKKTKLSLLPFLPHTWNWKVSFPFINSFYQIKVNSLFMENKEAPFWYSVEVAIRFRSLLIFLKSGKAACCRDCSQMAHEKRANKFHAKQILVENELAGAFCWFGRLWRDWDSCSARRGDFGKPTIFSMQRKNCWGRGTRILLKLFSPIMESIRK